jgi:hypothetical protein
MNTAMQILILLVMASVVVALFLGLRNMLRQGDANLSNKLMQARVFLQFVAVVLIVIAIYFFRPTA